MSIASFPNAPASWSTVFGTLRVDTDARMADVEYEMEDGSIVREEYEFSSPEKIIR